MNDCTKDIPVKTFPLSIFVLMGLMTPVLAAPHTSAVREIPRQHGIQAILINQDKLPNGGKVSEVIAASIYTYLHVVKDGKGTWLAIPSQEIPVGTEIRYGQGALMKSFRSSTLNRTFDEIYFLGGVETVGASSVPGVSGHPPVPAQQPSQESLSNSGRISEVVAAGNYSYLHVINEGKAIWLAIPRREIPVGTEVRYGQGTVMKSFYSSSLERTFDEVLFLGGVTVAGE